MPTAVSTRVLSPDSLGSRAFREQHNVRLAYVAGSMYQGIASPDMVVRMARARLLAFLGTGGLTLETIAGHLRTVVESVPAGASFGANLLHHPQDKVYEQATVDLLLRHDVRAVEAAAFLEITPALAYYRLKDIRRNHDGASIPARRVIGKASRPEIARHFLSPAPPELVAHLRNLGHLTAEQAEWATSLPIADDLCVEADSAGHTDQGVALALLPAMLNLRDAIAREYSPAGNVRVGLAGGLGTPQAIAAALIMGADFILTGSINQCTVEAGTSSRVKDLLQQAGPQDTAIVPAGDMLEIGAKMQVFRRGLLFPARAIRLYELYRDFPSWQAIPAETRQQVETRYFRQSYESVVAEIRTYYESKPANEWASLESKPKQLLAAICRWYFHHSTRWALEGDPDRVVDYQIHCGPALGAFNSWVQGTSLAEWRNRHVDEIADRLMTATAQLLSNRLEALAS